MILRRNAFATAVSDLETALGAEDRDSAAKAFERLHGAYQKASSSERRGNAHRLAALLPQIPPGPRAVVAVIVGACVEDGADPAACAGPVLAELLPVLRAARQFASAWGDDLPEFGDDAFTDEAQERVGTEAALAWATLPQWEMASLAMLNHAAVRAQLAEREELTSLAAELHSATDGDLKCLYYALLVLDDEPLVALHRDTRTGYLLRMSGLADNFQLHTLLAAALAGHVGVDAPSRKAVEVCRDAPGQVSTVGAFNLVTPDGHWLWNEGTPSDIPVLRGARVLVLDKPPYQRGWDAGRFFPGMTGELSLERVLTPEETESWFAEVAPARGFDGS